jgi:uncharacterized protein YjbI with pentapeptide repeats
MIWMSHLEIGTESRKQAFHKIFSVLVAFLLISGIFISSSTLPSVSAVSCSTPPGPGVDLSGCDLHGTDLTGVDLTNANLQNANLIGTTMDGNTILTGTNLAGANLSNSTLEYVIFDHAQVNGTYFIGADITGATFRSFTLFSNANFTQATTTADTNFQFSNLYNDDFRGATLENTDFTTTVLTNVNMQGSDLNFVDFTQAQFHNVLFSSSTRFVGAQFIQTSLSGQNLSGLDLHGVTFRGSDMSSSNISSANLQNSIFTCAVDNSNNQICTNINGANLSGSNVSGTDFTGVIFNSLTNLSNLIGACTGLTACSSGAVSPPVFTTPPNVSSPAISSSGAIVFYSLPIATGTLPLLGVICTPASGSTFPIGISVVNCQVAYVSDPSNIGYTSFTVTVQDTSPPQFSPNPPSNVITEATGSTGTNVFYPLPTVTDNVGVASETCNPVPGTLFALGTTPVSCIAKDAAGNSVTASFNVIVQDTTPPVISVPLPIIKEAAGPSGAAVTYSPLPAALDAVDPNPTLSCNPVSGSTFSLGPHTVTCTASDHATPTPNTSSKSFSVTVVDTTPPVVTPPPNITKVATGTLTPVTLGTATASDTVSGTLTPTNNATSGSFPLGTTIVIWSATDGSGNVGTAKQIVTITPNTNLGPTVTPPPNVGPVEATSPLTPVTLGTATATDPVYGTLTPTNNAPLGGFPVGTTIVTWSATNPAHVTGTATQTVKVVDTTKPVFTPTPTDLTFNAANATSTVVNYPLPPATDAVGVTSETCSPPPGSKFSLGSTLITCSAKDAAGNVGTATFNIIIKDLSPPVIQTSHVYAEATSQNGAIVNYPLPPVTDNIGVVPGSETCTPTSGSQFLFGDQTVTCSAKDAAGNVGSASFILTVRDTTPPTVIPPPDITKVSTGTLTPVTLGTATASDTVSGTLTPTNNAPLGGFPVGTTIVTWSATDGSGNVGTAQQIITITSAHTQISSYVIFGMHDVHIEQHDTVTGGNVGLQNSGQIHIEQSSKLTSSSIVGDTLHIEQNSIVNNVYFNHIINKGTILGTSNTPLGLPVLTSLPAIPTFTTGTTNINVKSGTQVIAPGKYNSISGNNGVTLEFSGGTYNINSLSFGNHVTLKFDKNSTINVQNSVDGGQNTILNPTLLAHQVLIYSGAQIHIGQSSTINANMYAPYNQIHLEQNSIATGAFIGQSVHIEQGSTINFDYGFPIVSNPCTDNHHRVYDQNGYDQNGYDKNGYDKNGYDCYGYDKTGHDHNGHDHSGFKSKH